MKKFFISFLSCIVIISVFALPVSAETIPDDPNPVYYNVFEYGENYESKKQSIISACENPDSLAYGGFKSRQTYDFYFCYIDKHNSPEFLRFVYFNTNELVYDEENGLLKKSDGSSFNYAWSSWSAGQGRGSSYENNATSFSLATGYDSVPIQVILQDTNLKIKGYNDNDPNQPPATVFTYTIDEPNFKLVNDKYLEVTLRYTDEFYDWCDHIRIKDPSFNPCYQYVCYVSKYCPTNTETLLQSLDDTRYIDFSQYGEYVYEGGVGYAELSTGGDYIAGEKPTSHSGKSPWTTAHGVHICDTYYAYFPDGQKCSNLNFGIKLENILGYDEHTPIYVCVFANYLGNIESSNTVQPNQFNTTVLSSALAGHSTPNDTYVSFWGDDVDPANDDSDYTMHLYYFPFESVSNAVGDGYNGHYTYKAWSYNGVEYGGIGKVTDFTNKAITPDELHDVDMNAGQWVKPEDYHSWQVDFYNKNKYNSEFKYDTKTLKDVFDSESDFFKFITVSFNALPDYFISIFTGFLYTLFAIILLKRIL